MNKKNEWWARDDRRWHRVKYSDEPGKYFWDRSCGVFDLAVSRKERDGVVHRGVYNVMLTCLDGSIDRCHSEEYRGSVEGAKAFAMSLAADVLWGLYNRVDE